MKQILATWALFGSGVRLERRESGPLRAAGKWIAWNALKENILDQGGLEPTISGLRALRSTDLS